MYTSYKGDEALKDIIISIYNFIQSTPFPKKWLDEKVELLNTKSESFEKTKWGEILFSKAKDELKDSILKLKERLEKIKYEEDIEKYIQVISEDIRKIQKVYEQDTWDDLLCGIKELKFDRFPSDKRVSEEVKNKIKELRDSIKTNVKKISEKILIYNSNQANEDIHIMYSILLKIKNLTLEFSDRFSKVKQEKNLMDFSDIEHFALQILTKEEEKTNHVCKKYQEKYEEILIDEYQDSNLVQETILNAVSQGRNTFMVGDVKQSIYKFRQARPELFLEKYEEYKEIEQIEENDNLKIKLFKNFRSRKNILTLTNIIFESIMSKELGDIDYTEEEYLNFGASYEEMGNLKTEIDIIDLKTEEDIYEEDETEEIKIEDAIIEAKFVAKRIKELIQEGFTVTDKNNKKRNLIPKDIAILLRSTKTLAPIYEQEISKLNLPVFCDTSSRIFR